MSVCERERESDSYFLSSLSISSLFVVQSFHPSLSTELTYVIFENMSWFFFLKTTEALTKPHRQTSLYNPKGHEVYYYTKNFIRSYKPSPGRFRLCLLCRRLSANKLWFNDDKYQTKHREHTTTD